MKMEQLKARAVHAAPKTCLAVHLAAWCAAVTAWTFIWRQQGPYPAGPPYNQTNDAIGNLDFLMYHTAHEWSLSIAIALSSWADLGATYIVAYAVLILLAGSLQWFLLGRLVQWVDLRLGRSAALSLLGIYGLWAVLILIGLALF